MTTSEPTAAEREQQLVKLRKRMGRLLRRGESAEYDRLAALYATQKAEHVQRTHEEYVAERRAAAVARRAQEQVDREAQKPWRLPRGFGRSPLAQQRDRTGWRPREEPRGPEGGLRPWRRRGGLMAEQIWRPPS